MSTQETSTVDEEAIRLFTVMDEHNQVNSVIPIRWCISRESARLIQDQEIEDPQLLLVITKNGREMDRHVVPLTDMMRYVQFRSPGENLVHATVVWKRGSKDPKKVLTDRFDTGEYKAEAVTSGKPQFERIMGQISDLEDKLYLRTEDEDEKTRLRTQLDQLKAEAETYRQEPDQVTIRGNFDSVRRLEQEAQLEVVVPEGMFAKKPPAWMSWLGKRYTFWNGAPRDECDLRRRAIFTAVTSPFALIGIGLVLIIAAMGLTVVALANTLTTAALLLCGMRGMDLQQLNPFEHDPRDIWAAKGPSFWLHRRKTTKAGKESPFGFDKYEDRATVFYVLNPATIVVVVLIGGVVGFFTSTILAGILIALGILVIIAAIVAVVVSGPIKRWKAEQRELRQKAEEKARQNEQDKLRKELEMMTCSNQSSEVSLKALPKERRTVVLRFQALKAEVCKPFAKV